MPSVADKMPGYDRSFQAVWAETHGYLRNTVVPRTAQMITDLAEVKAQNVAILKAVQGGNADAVLAEVKKQGEQTRAALLAHLEEIAPSLAQEIADGMGNVEQPVIEQALRRVLGSLDSEG